MHDAKDRRLLKAKIALQSAIARLQNVKRYLRDCVRSSPPAPQPNSDPPTMPAPPPGCAGRYHFVHDQQIVECPLCPR